jgi:ABC-type sugar transport system permease subunit
MTVPQRTRTAPRTSPLLVSQARSERIRAIKNFITAMLFLSPSLVIFISFVFVPLLQTIQLSFFYTDPIGRVAGFAGLDNYTRVFLEDKDIWNSLRVSLLFALYVVPFTMIASLFLAVVANVQLKGISIFRVIFSSTIAVSAAAASLIFLFLFHPAIGIFNYALDLVHLPRVGWLTSDATALFSLALVTIWLTLGFNTIIFLAAMQGISQELYESATIDGAGFWQSFRHITIPMISPTLFFLIVVSTLNSLQAFAQIDVMSRGGPNHATESLVYVIYRAFYFDGRYGFAAAMSIFLFLLMLAFTILQFGVLERRVHYA